MDKVWSDKAWNDYMYWQENDKKMVKKINDLLKDIERYGVLGGKGKPEALKHNMAGSFSRRIDDANRLVYNIKENKIYIYMCYGHY